MEKKSCLELTFRTYMLVFLLVLSISFTLISFSFEHLNFATTADEGYYLKYATYIGEKGLCGFPILFKNYIDNQQHWVYPNPLRAGFIILSAAWLRIFGYSFLNLAYLSLFSYFIFLLLSFYFVKKYFGDKIALLFIILLAFSPLNMAMARRALTDATTNLFTFTSIWLFFENLQERKTYKIFLFILIYTFTILIKENSVLLSPFFVFYILIRKHLFKDSLKSRDFLGLALIPCVIAGAVYFTLAGNISYVIDTARIIISSPSYNQYAIFFGSGPWYRYLIDFMLLSPWVCILAISFALNYITKNERKEEISYLLLLSISLLFLYNFFTKNVRYLIILDMPIRLFAILMLSELTELLFKNKSAKALVFLVVAIAFFDYYNFNYLFLRHGIYDPVSQYLLKALRIIPWE